MADVSSGLASLTGGGWDVKEPSEGGQFGSINPVASIMVATKQPRNMPTIVAHRGGPNIEPEESMQAYRAAYASGIRYLEIDCHRLADGNVAVMHDITVDRTTDGTGNVNSFTLATWKALKLDPLTANSAAYAAVEAPPTMAEVLDWAVDKDVVIVGESKTAEVVVPMLRELQMRSFPKSKFIWQSFSDSHLVIAKAAGYPCQKLETDPTIAGAQAAAAAGYEHYGGDYANWTQAEVSAAKALGLRAWAYTLHRRSDIDAMASLGIDYVFVNDPIHAIGLVNVKSVPFSAGRFMPGHFGMYPTDPAVQRGQFNADGTWQIGTNASATYQGAMMGCLGPIGGAAGLPSSYTISVTFTIDSVFAATRWVGIALNMASDASFQDSAPDGACHHILFRQSGVLDVYSKLAGASAALGASQTGTALTLGTSYTATISVTPTGVSVTCNGTTTTFNDARFRGGYVQIGSNGAVVRFSDVSVSY